MSLSSIAKQLLTLSLGLTQSLSQEATNGNSNLGTLSAPKLPKFLTNNPMPNGAPWGTATANNTNPYTNPPNTGVIRSYDFTIKRGKLAPDGYLKDVLLINDQYPGPTIEANWGDTIQVTVHNQIDGPPEGTSVHWHGILQTATPWYDGVPSVQQCPIAPGANFTYSFIADLYGTSWYHSHYSAQYAGGLHGPMIIYGPKNANYDIDLGPVFINDWYHKDYFSIVESVVGMIPPSLSAVNDLLPASDNNLINGKMNFDCSTVKDGTPCTNNAGISKFQFTTGKVHRLRLINSGAEGIQKFSIDGHSMTVMANDFVEVQPYQTNIVTLGVGQRTDILVTANYSSNSVFWMRSSISTCSSSNQPDALAAIYYDQANHDQKPSSTALKDTTDPCANDALTQTVPYYSITPDPNPEKTQEVDITGALNSTGHFNFEMNGQTFRANYDDPLLLLAHEGNTSYPNDPQWNVYNFGEAKTIRLVVHNLFPAAHPMHMHGHNFFVLDSGLGVYSGQMVNPQNPQRRDVQLLPPLGYVVLQINADNPGVWPFHCHIAWHVSGGLYINIMERPADITEMQIPDVMAQTCTDWHTYSHSNVVDEIDSGL